MRRQETEALKINSKTTRIPVLEGSLAVTYSFLINQQAPTDRLVTIQLEPAQKQPDSLLVSQLSVPNHVINKVERVTQRFTTLQDEVKSLTGPSDRTKTDLQKTLYLWQADETLKTLTQDTNQGPFYREVRKALSSSDQLHPLEKIKRRAKADPEAPQWITSLLTGSPLLTDIGLRVLHAAPQWGTHTSIQEALGKISVRVSDTPEDFELGLHLINQAKYLYRVLETPDSKY